MQQNIDTNRTDSTSVEITKDSESSKSKSKVSGIAITEIGLRNYSFTPEEIAIINSKLDRLAMSTHGDGQSLSNFELILPKSPRKVEFRLGKNFVGKSCWEICDSIPANVKSALIHILRNNFKLKIPAIKKPEPVPELKLPKIKTARKTTRKPTKSKILKVEAPRVDLTESKLVRLISHPNLILDRLHLALAKQPELEFSYRQLRQPVNFLGVPVSIKTGSKSGFVTWQVSSANLNQLIEALLLPEEKELYFLAPLNSNTSILFDLENLSKYTKDRPLSTKAIMEIERVITNVKNQTKENRVQQISLKLKSERTYPITLIAKIENDTLVPALALDKKYIRSMLRELQPEKPPLPPRKRKAIYAVLSPANLADNIANNAPVAPLIEKIFNAWRDEAVQKIPPEITIGEGETSFTVRVFNRHNKLEVMVRKSALDKLHSYLKAEISSKFDLTLPYVKLSQKGLTEVLGWEMRNDFRSWVKNRIVFDEQCITVPEVDKKFSISHSSRYFEHGSERDQGLCVMRLDEFAKLINTYAALHQLEVQTIGEGKYAVFCFVRLGHNTKAKS